MREKLLKQLSIDLLNTYMTLKGNCFNIEKDKEGLLDAFVELGLDKYIDESNYYTMPHPIVAEIKAKRRELTINKIID